MQFAAFIWTKWDTEEDIDPAEFGRYSEFNTGCASLQENRSCSRRCFAPPSGGASNLACSPMSHLRRCPAGP